MTKFQNIFENYRNFLNEEQLLVEARETDALKRVVKGIKNEDIQEFLTSSIETIFDIDPSGNQKYALWVAKILNNSAHETVKHVKKEGFAVADYLDSVKAGINSVVQSIKQNLALYHKLTQRNLIEKDINKFSSAPDWAHTIYRANKELEEKERMKAIAKQAKSETDVLQDDEDYMIVRPRSKEGSCYFGQGTKWCISATQSQNYFDSYTGEGKGFYFVFFHHLPQKDTAKKLALVYEPGYDRDEPSEVYNVTDDEVQIHGLRDAVESNLLMKGFWDSLPDKKKVKKILAKKPEEVEDIATKISNELDLFRDRDTSQGTTETLSKAFTALGILEGSEEVEEVEEAFEELVSEQLWDIIGSSAHHWNENPAGPSEEDYQKIEDEYDLQHFYVSREEMDEGRMYWDAGTSFQFDDVDDLVEDAVDTDELRNFVDGALDSHYIYGEVEDNSYGGSIEISVRINPDHGESEGIEGFSSFMETVASADKEWQNVYDDVIDKMKGAGWIPGESVKALLEKFNEMKFQNFDAELEDGNIAISSRLNVKLLLPEELKIGDRKLASGGASRLTINPKKIMWRSIVEELGSERSVSSIKNQLIARLENVLKRAMKIVASQLKLPLNEEKAPFNIPDINIQLGSMGTLKQGSMGGGGPLRKDHDISDTYTYYLDIVVEGKETEEEIIMIQKFLSMIDKEEFFEKIRQYTEGLVNNQLQKEIIPKAKEEYEKLISQQQSAQQTTDELSTLFENWRSFIK